MSQVKVNFQTNDDASFKIEFNDNQRYLNNGEIVFPKNSLGYIVDESELITLVKPCGDPYISFKITDTQFADLAAFEDWFAENAVSTGGGIDPETLAELVSSAEYVSSSSTIDFKNMDGDVISTINAEPFITDGMVDNVQISGTNLVITFNVDAGKQPISIPLSSIFDPSNYYDKTATDTLLNGKVAVSDYNTYTAATNTALSGKADTSAVTAVSDALSGKADTSAVTEVEEVLAQSINVLSESLSGKADVSAVTAISDALSGKLDTSAYTQVTTTTAVTSGSTDVITSGGVYAQLDGMKLRKVTESQWETISGSTDASTLYVVIPDPNQA